MNEALHDEGNILEGDDEFGDDDFGEDDFGDDDALTEEGTLDGPSNYSFCYVYTLTYWFQTLQIRLRILMPLRKLYFLNLKSL